MTETRRRRDIRLDQAKENAEAGYATRRQLIGLGAAGAAAVGGTALLVGTLMPKPETPATADAPATTRTPSPSATPKTTPSSVPTSSAPPTTPPDTITPAPDRPNAQKPYAGGGPRTRDESFTQAEPGTSVPPGRQTTAYSRAAAAATPVQQSVFASADAKSHLLRRATFGARPADVAELDRLGIDGWIEQQLHPETIPDAAADSLAAQLPYGDASPARIWQGVASDAFDEYSWTPMYQTAQLAMGRQLFSKRQLLEVLVDVFSDQVHVPLPSDQWHTSPDYIAQVVRPHALGKFRDMLIAAMRHPAMLYYLSNDQSRGNRVNENLGRELLELHSVGISGGYTEADVLASARILSGRAVEYRSGTFSYHPEWHYVGPVSVLGFSHPNSTAAGGLEVGDAYVTYLAEHPATARAVARRLAVRFVGDRPSEDLVERLAAVYLSSGTDIRAVVSAIFLSTDFWSAVGLRMRRPLEDIVGTGRVLDVAPGADTAGALGALYWAVNSDYHAPYQWPAPNGYPDVAAAWLSAGSQISRWNVHRRFLDRGFGKFTYVDPATLVTPTAGQTASEWLTALEVRLVGQALSADHHAALLSSVGLTGTEAAKEGVAVSRNLAALILDSAYFQLR